MADDSTDSAFGFILFILFLAFLGYAAGGVSGSASGTSGGTAPSLPPLAGTHVDSCPANSYPNRMYHPPRLHPSQPRRSGWTPTMPAQKCATATIARHGRGDGESHYGIYRR